MTITPLGGEPPNAWKHAHNTAMSNPHHATAPSVLGLRSRSSSIAVRTPVAAVAEAADTRMATRDTRRRPALSDPIIRLTSTGSVEMPRNTEITIAPKIAGTIVIANGA